LLTILPVAMTMTLIPQALPGQDASRAMDRWNWAAMEWIGFLKAGEYEKAGERVSPEVPEDAMTPDRLHTIWSQLSAQLGVLQSLDPGLVVSHGGYHVVDLPAAFQNAEVVIRVSLSDLMMVAGFWILPAEPPPYSPPAYVDLESFVEREVTVGSEPWSLPGALTLPKGEGPFPAVVLVHGSGPNDRDETVGGNRPFRDLAWGLASQGVAVLRYDKRTKVYGGSLPPDIGLDDEVVEDALSALTVARTIPEIDADRVFLLGHSLGGMMAPAVASRDAGLAGVAILAAPARSPLALRQLDSLIALVDRIESDGWGAEETLLGAPAAYWKEWSAVDPVTLARGLDLPLLVLQGGRDYQSTPEDLELWRQGMAGEEGFHARLYPNLNHLFAPGEGTATPAEYTTEVKHVAVEVVHDLASWMKGIGPKVAPPKRVRQVVPAT
jgi:dienelactone hydrolase